MFTSGHHDTMDPTPVGSPLRPDGVVTLAHVIERVGPEWQGSTRRDTLSALRVLVTRLALDPTTITATPTVIRALFETADRHRLGVSERRYTNLRSAVVRAIDAFGMHRRRLTKGTPLTPAWEALLAAAGSQPYRQGIKRLAHFCSASGIAPERVDCETLRDLHEALVDECIVKNPRAIIKHTIAVWNMMGRRIPGWPTTVLSSPFATEPHALPLSAFPQTFQDDVARWEARMTDPDPLDLEAPLRALRPATLKGYHMIFRRFASALVRQGIVPLEAMTGLHVFFQGRHFREGLRYFLRRNDPAGAAETAKIAGMLGKVARHYVRVDEPSEREIKAVLRRLEPGVVRGMGRRNRERLDQFDAPEAVRAILSFPEAEAARARARRSPGRRARGMERALAVRLLIDTGLRIGNLRQIRFDSLRRIGATTYLRVPGAQVKNGVELEHVLPAGTVALIDEFVHEHRGHLPGSQGPYLFPGQDGGPKSDGAMRACVSEPIRKHTGLTMSPHLFRHVIAKIVVERDPTLYVAVSRHLGHKSINTTLGSYLGTETRAASRHLHQILDTAREEV